MVERIQTLETAFSYLFNEQHKYFFYL